MANYIKFKYTDGTKVVNTSTLDEALILLDTSNRKLYARNTSFGLPLITDKPEDISTARDKQTYTISVNVYNNLINKIEESEEVISSAITDLAERMEQAESGVVKIDSLSNNITSEIFPFKAGWHSPMHNCPEILTTLSLGDNFYNYDTIYAQTNTNSNLSINKWSLTKHNITWGEKNIIVENTSSNAITVTIPAELGEDIGGDNGYVIFPTNSGHIQGMPIAIQIGAHSFAEINFLQMPQMPNGDAVDLTNDNEWRVVFLRYTN